MERLRESAPEMGSSVEASPEAQIMAEGSRRLARELLQGPENAIAREVAEKLFQKAEIKERSAQLMAGADEVGFYQEYKKLGLFVVRDTEAVFDYGDEESGLDLKRGDKILELHVPPVPAGKRSREEVDRSLALIEEYVDEHGLEPKYLLGVTYERLAKLAKRQFGFSVAYPTRDQLPVGLVDGIERVHQNFTDAGAEGRDMGRPVIVFLEAEIEPEPAVDEERQEHLERMKRVADHISGLIF